MKELYAVRIVFENGTEISFDSDRPLELANGLTYLKFPNGSETIVNRKYLVCASSTHLTLTDEEYVKRRKLLNHEE